jgi:hypothetical protein
VSEQLVECFRDLSDYLGGHMLLSLSALAVACAGGASATTCTDTTAGVLAARCWSRCRQS